ncbi:Nrap protein-domain-containing protein [Lentinula raphanica]|nr:Nrap protein-domain-containing protein [Lentinula raphanica]
MFSAHENALGIGQASCRGLELDPATFPPNALACDYHCVPRHNHIDPNVTGQFWSGTGRSNESDLTDDHPTNTDVNRGVSERRISPFPQVQNTCLSLWLQPGMRRGLRRELLAYLRRFKPICPVFRCVRGGSAEIVGPLDHLVESVFERFKDTTGRCTLGYTTDVAARYANKPDSEVYGDSKTPVKDVNTRDDPFLYHYRVLLIDFERDKSDKNKCGKPSDGSDKLICSTAETVSRSQSPSFVVSSEIVLCPSALTEAISTAYISRKHLEKRTPIFFQLRLSSSIVHTSVHNAKIPANTFKLQIDALLPNVQPKPKRKPPLERFLFSLHAFLSNLPDVPPKHPLEAARGLLKKGVSIPYPITLPTEETQWKVAFSRPSDITLVGSWANNTAVKGQGKSRFGVELAVEMPSSIFQEKDYLNGRFFHEKAYYLATIGAAIADPKSGLNVDVSYMSTNDDPSITKIVLEPRADGSETDFSKLHARIYIMATISSTAPIPLHRLSPVHANLRITPESSSSSVQHVDDSVKTQSPLYNNAILTSFVPKPYLLSVHAIQQAVPEFNHALVLIRVWANQSGYGDSGYTPGVSIRGFDGKGPWWASLSMYLILGEEPTSAGRKSGVYGRRRPLGKGLSSYQLFTAALDFLAKHDFENEPVFVKTEGGHRSVSTSYTPDEYSSSFDLVFVDSSSTVNLLAGVPPGSLKLLGDDARRTLDMLNNSSGSSVDPFPEVFLRDHRALQTRFDIVLRYEQSSPIIHASFINKKLFFLQSVDLSTAKPRKSDIHSTLDTGSASNAILSSIYSVLDEALGDRVKAIGIMHPTPSTRPLSQANPSSSHIIHIGLI